MLLVVFGPLLAVNVRYFESGDQSTPDSRPAVLMRLGGPPATGSRNRSDCSLSRVAAVRSASVPSLAISARVDASSVSARNSASAVKTIHLPSGETTALRWE